MRNLCTLLVTTLISLGLLAAAAGQETRKADDPEKVLAAALKAFKQKDDVEQRIEAASTLADFGPKAIPALPELLEAVQDKNEDLRLNASLVLAKIGPEAIKPLAKLLASDDASNRFYAVWTLGLIGPDAKEAIPAVIKLTKDKDEGVRRKAVGALGRLAGDPDKVIDVLVNAFRDENEDVRQAASESLAKYGKPAVPALIELLKENNAAARMQAATALGEIGSDAKDAVPLLREQFLAKEIQHAQHYALVLAKIGKPAMPALEAGLKDGRNEVRHAASAALQQAGADAVGVLIDALGDKNVEVRRIAAMTLFPMRIGDKTVVIALAFGLNDPDDVVRQYCMNGLAQLGPQAKLGSAKIKEALHDTNTHVRSQAYHLLQQIGEDPRPMLLKGLQSKDDKIRINTAGLMVNVSFDAQKAMPILLDALKHDDLALRMQAASTLAQRQQHTDKVLPIFLDGFKHQSPGVRVQALQGVSFLGNTGQGAAPSIADLLRDADSNVRQHAVYALNNIRGEPQKVVPVLETIYKDGNADAKRMVLQVAWMYGGKAKDLIFDGLRDKDANVRQQAVNAVSNLQGDLTEALPAIAKMMHDKELAPHRQQFLWLFARAGEAGAPHLGEFLKDSDENIRVQAMQVLRNMGPQAAKALPQIKAAINDKNANVRLNAMIIVASVGKEADFLIKQFEKETDGNVRVSILQSLAYAGQAAVAAPLLPVAMKDKDAQVRAMCVQMIGYFGNASKEGFAIFTAGMKDEDSRVRVSAAHHAHFFGQKTWPHLEEALAKTKDSTFREALVQGMINTSYKSKASVKPLIECLKDKSVNTRIWAAHILGNIGPDAAEALPALREMTKDPNQGVQNTARNAIAQIDRKQK